MSRAWLAWSGRRRRLWALPSLEPGPRRRPRPTRCVCVCSCAAAVRSSRRHASKCFLEPLKFSHRTSTHLQQCVGNPLPLCACSDLAWRKSKMEYCQPQTCPTRCSCGGHAPVAFCSQQVCCVLHHVRYGCCRLTRVALRFNSAGWTANFGFTIHSSCVPHACYCVDVNRLELPCKIPVANSPAPPSPYWLIFHAPMLCMCVHAGWPFPFVFVIPSR